jgi:hypothetical protein
VKGLGPAALACVLVLAGCGLGPGRERSGGAELRVTRDFGHGLLAVERLRRVPEDQTVMQFLRSRLRVKTSYGGRFVQAIDGLSGKGPSGGEDWFYFVNGLEAEVGAAEKVLSPGDLVQWDYRSWRAAMSVPAVVGAFPEPFRHGIDGRRLPVRVECERPSSPACRTVTARLRAAGVGSSVAGLGASSGTKLIRVVVARWPRARRLGAVAALEEPPARSRVFARFGPGSTLELLDPAGRPARRAAPGTGLVAALAPRGTALTWLVTGTDDRGVAAAARAVDARDLRDAYAVAATPSGVEKLPLP